MKEVVKIKGMMAFASYHLKNFPAKKIYAVKMYGRIYYCGNLLQEELRSNKQDAYLDAGVPKFWDCLAVGVSQGKERKMNNTDKLKKMLEKIIDPDVLAALRVEVGEEWKIPHEVREKVRKILEEAEKDALEEAEKDAYEKAKTEKVYPISKLPDDTISSIFWMALRSIIIKE